MQEILELDDDLREGFCIIAEEQSGRGKYNFGAGKFEGDK